MHPVDSDLSHALLAGLVALLTGALGIIIRLLNERMKKMDSDNKRQWEKLDEHTQGLTMCETLVESHKDIFRDIKSRIETIDAKLDRLISRRNE